MEKDTDSTVTSLEENTENFCENATRDILAEGLTKLLSSAVEKLDTHLVETKSAQSELSEHLDNLLATLAKIENSEESHPKIRQSANKLAKLKNKITIISNILQVAQERLNNVHKLGEKEHLKHLRLAAASSSRPQ